MGNLNHVVKQLPPKHRAALAAVMGPHKQRALRAVAALKRDGSRDSQAALKIATALHRARRGDPSLAEKYARACRPKYYARPGETPELGRFGDRFKRFVHKVAKRPVFHAVSKVVFSPVVQKAYRGLTDVVGAVMPPLKPLIAAQRKVYGPIYRAGRKLTLGDVKHIATVAEKHGHTEILHGAQKVLDAAKKVAVAKQTEAYRVTFPNGHVESVKASEVR